MKKTVHKKTVVLAVSYLTAAVLALGVLAGVYYERARQSELYAANNYQHAFGELVTAMTEMDAALQKSVYAVSPSMVSAVCTEVFGKAMTAQMALGVLPFSSEELEQTSGFISRVGDYAYAVSRSAAAGGGCTEEQRRNLKSLSDTATVLSENLKGLQTDLNDGHLTLTELKRSQATLSETEDSAVPGYMGDSIRLIEQEFPEVPSLIYDGPFSEHLTGQTPKALEGLETVDEAGGRAAAAGFLGINKAKVYTTGQCAGDIPCRSYAADMEGGATVYVSVSEQGGRVISMLSSRPVGSAQVEAAEAVSAAKRFLTAAGYEGMEETYHMTQGGILTVNFAFRQDNVLCYSDLIKVSVALDTGKVCGFEAKGFLTAHSSRALPAVSVDESAARAGVPEALEVLSHQIALVPSDGQYETLCHEFKCQAEDGRHYIIYVNAVTGAQEKILILLEDDSGALTL